MVLLGAGGAARAIAVELTLARCGPLTVVNRTPQPADALVELLRANGHSDCQALPWQGAFQIPSDAQIVINATSIGLNDPAARVPVATATLLPSMVVADVVFNPPRTQFLATATAAGCTTLDGLGMLVNQGVISFKLWTGVSPNPDVMREALEEYLEI